MNKKQIRLNCIYVSVDNTPGEPNGKGWVDLLYDYITYVTKREYQTAVDFNKVEIGPEDLPTPEPGTATKETIELVVLSESALTDDKWRGYIEQMALEENDIKLITLVKEPLVSNDLPAELISYPKFDFYLTDPRSGKIIDTETLLTSPYLNSFLFKIFDLVKVLRNYDCEASKESSKSVYLALTSYDLAPVRDNIRRALIQQQYRVLPEIVYPYTTEDLESVIYDDVRKCQLSLHLVGRHYDNNTYDSELPITAIQHRVASEYHKALVNEFDDHERPEFSRIIWLPERDAKLEEKQSRFISELYTEKNDLEGTELVRGSVEELKDIVINKLSDVPGLSLGYKEVESRNEKKSIYIMARSQYNKTYEKIKGIFENNEIDVITSDVSLNHEDLVVIHRQSLLSCDGVLFLAEPKDLFWLRSKMNDVHKAYSWGRNKPYLTIGVLSSGIEQLPEDSTFDQVMLVQKTGRFNNHLLTPFIDKIV